MYIFSIQTVDAFTMACKTEHPSEYISKNISLEIFQWYSTFYLTTFNTNLEMKTKAILDVTIVKKSYIK